MSWSVVQLGCSVIATLTAISAGIYFGKRLLLDGLDADEQLGDSADNLTSLKYKLANTERVVQRLEEQLLTERETSIAIRDLNVELKETVESLQAERLALVVRCSSCEEEKISLHKFIDSQKLQLIRAKSELEETKSRVELREGEHTHERELLHERTLRELRESPASGSAGRGQHLYHLHCSHHRH